MVIRVDLECEAGHRLKDVILESFTDQPLKYPPCHKFVDGAKACLARTDQVFDGRKDSEGYFVMRGVNW